MPRVASCACGSCERCRSRAYAAASRARAAAPTAAANTPTTCKNHPDRNAIAGRRVCNECRGRALGRKPRVPRTPQPCASCATTTVKLRKKLCPRCYDRQWRGAQPRTCVDCNAPSGAHVRCESCFAEYVRARDARPNATPVMWDQDLTLLRKALPAGAAVGLSARGVVVDLIGERKLFPDMNAALDWATTPQAEN
jgi:hypothetical protein